MPDNVPPLWLCTFASDPSFLLVYVPAEFSGSLVRFPMLRAPFTESAVKDACLDAGLDVRVTKDVVGRELRVVLQRRRSDERAERRQKAKLAEAVHATISKGSADEFTRRRGEATQQRLQIEEEMRSLKMQLADAGREAHINRVFLPALQHKMMTERLEELRLQMLANQALFTELRKEEKRRNMAQSRTRDNLFIEKVKQLLDPEQVRRIWEEVDAEECAP